MSFNDARSTKGEDAQAAHHPIVGWPVKLLMQLDRAGARGLIADLIHAGVLTRQAAYVAVACVDLDAPCAFLDRLKINRDDAEGIGIALRQRRARDVIAATFGVIPSDVPAGYLRALARIEESGAKAPGVDAFARADTYRILFELLRDDRHGRRANALRYSSKMRSDVVDAALALDPVLAWPEILNSTGTPQRVAAANAMLATIRACLSTSDEAELVATMRRSLGQSGGVLSSFAGKVLERADCLPTPIPAAEGIRPLRTGEAYVELGKRFRNCAATKIPEVALGLLCVVEVVHKAADGTETPTAVSCTPLVDGRWMVSEVGTYRNRRPPTVVMRDVLKRLQALGVIIPGPHLNGPYRADLGELMGVYRFRALDDALHPHGDVEDGILAGLEDWERA
ncbi:hypothetical protein MMSR116_08595 [Methylobacterium mesophilicum SR1.6/6]|uniref:Uncharacterized protein n=1 Tax=Methylobacterium mesophilicum SR1.6/6 TaxID=908290 RepID=A0A6B9FH18_9HYPH|nr:hypothetical protein [Methylobacterium mesophilicum]QGY01930.1 hypothetical protein MMSR116_08595 [Methylobacterium mesophilicum SR1.6/6]